MSLWRLDLLGAIRYYPPLVLSAVWIAELDVRLAADLFLRTDRCMRSYRPLWRWLAVAGLILVTLLLRNVLWLAFSIDPLGDFIG